MLKFVFNLLVQSCCFIIFPEAFMVRCLEVMRMDTVYPKEGELQQAMFYSFVVLEEFHETLVCYL